MPLVGVASGRKSPRKSVTKKSVGFKSPAGFAETLPDIPAALSHLRQAELPQMPRRCYFTRSERPAGAILSGRLRVKKAKNR